jgi:hypothetical protein
MTCARRSTPAARPLARRKCGTQFRLPACCPEVRVGRDGRLAHRSTTGRLVFRKSARAFPDRPERAYPSRVGCRSQSTCHLRRGWTFHRVFNGIAPSSLRSLTGTFSVKRAVVLSLVYMNPPANQLVRTEGGFQILPKVGAELS